MPTRNLNPADNFTTVCQWLDENLQGPIIPAPANLNQVPQEKGLYFWFMRPEGYKTLSKYVEISPVDPRYERVIDGVKYYLVYIGQAGVRNNKSGTNEANLQKRIKWHISDNNGPTNVSNNTMSTFRRTIGPLISDDLILNNTQNDIDTIFEKFFRVYCIKYGTNFSQIGALVLNDEHILIDRLRPLFNFDHNPNARSKGHITYQIRVRRRRVEASTKTRLGCGTGTRTLLKEKKTKSAKRTIVQSSVELSDCITFKVKSGESVHDVVNKRSDLPIGPCWILIYNSKNKKDLIYRSRINGGWRKTGTKRGQNIYDYFSAPDTNRNNLLRYKIIQQEMRQQRPPVESVTVKVCPFYSEKGKNKPPETQGILEPKPGGVPPSTKSKAESVPVSENKDGDVIYLVPCSSSKIKLEELLKKKKKSSINQLEFNNEIGALRRQLVGYVKKATSHIRNVNSEWKERTLGQKIDFNVAAVAKDVYGRGRLFTAAGSTGWSKRQASKVYIVSALFGIIRADSLIPRYDLAMKDKLTCKGKILVPHKYWKCKLDRILRNLINSNQKVYSLLSSDYKTILCSDLLDELIEPDITPYNPTRLKRRLSKPRGLWLRAQFEQEVL